MTVVKPNVTSNYVLTAEVFNLTNNAWSNRVLSTFFEFDDVKCV